MVNSPTLIQLASQRAYNSFIELSKFSGKQRNQGIKAMAVTIEGAFDQILEANTLDLETSREMAVPDILLEWLKLTPERLHNTVDLLQALVNCPDPLQRVINAPYQSNSDQTYYQLMPLGVIALIYETFPDLGVMTAGFALKTGNSLMLRGCVSSSHTNNVITELLKTAIKEAGLPPHCVECLPCDQGNLMEEIVTQSQYLNLVVPYGRPSLTEQVSQLATVPVLKLAMGNCYLYWSNSGDWELVHKIIIESHDNKPDPVNAIEKVLISSPHNSSYLLRLFSYLEEQGFQLKGDDILVEKYSDYLAPISISDWHTPYFSKTVAFKQVGKLEEAIKWINYHSSGHADCIVTESYQESRQFAMAVDSALVYINTSPRFSRNPKQGESLLLGISNQKGLRRGLVSLDALTTYKQVVQGYEADD
ncbi:MAG: glutamate-5-semialdehyde dehydrogenase [Microcystaceae cyanobacterium]